MDTRTSSGISRAFLASPQSTTCSWPLTAQTPCQVNRPTQELTAPPMSQDEISLPLLQRTLLRHYLYVHSYNNMMPNTAFIASWHALTSTGSVHPSFYLVCIHSSCWLYHGWTCLSCILRTASLWRVAKLLAEQPSGRDLFQELKGMYSTAMGH